MSFADDLRELDSNPEKIKESTIKRNRDLKTRGQNTLLELLPELIFESIKDSCLKISRAHSFEKQYVGVFVENHYWSTGDTKDTAYDYIDIIRSNSHDYGDSAKVRFFDPFKPIYCDRMVYFGKKLRDGYDKNYLLIYQDNDLQMNEDCKMWRCFVFDEYIASQILSELKKKLEESGLSYSVNLMWEQTYYTYISTKERRLLANKKVSKKEQYKLICTPNPGHIDL